MLPSPIDRRVGIRIDTFEACSDFTRVTARWIAQQPKAAFVARLRHRPVTQASRSPASRPIGNYLASLTKYSCVWFCFRSKASPLRACSSRGTNLYPAGYNPSQGPSCALRGRGLRGRWDHSLPRRLSALSRSGHTSTLDFISSCYRCWAFLPFENSASRNQASFKITP